MNLQPYFNELKGSSRISKKIQVVRFLAPLIKDLDVVDAFCDVAISTTDSHLRIVIIDVLKENAAEANWWFSEIVLHSTDPDSRKWALVNLSLIGCDDARDAVILGLNDNCAAVRKAAALSAGLYHDRAVQNALEDYFEKYRFELMVSLISDGIQKLREKVQFTQNDGAVNGPVDNRQSVLRMDSGQ